MALILTPEQADLMAEEIGWKLGAIMESAGNNWEPESLLKACEAIDPLRAAIRELVEKRAAEDLALLGGIAGEALSNHRDSAGHALSTIHQVKAGRIVEFRTSDAETPEEIIKREQADAELFAEKAALAHAVVWAVQHAEAAAEAAEGDPRAKESLAAHERWADENRQLAEAS